MIGRLICVHWINTINVREKLYENKEIKNDCNDYSEYINYCYDGAGYLYDISN